MAAPASGTQKGTTFKITAAPITISGFTIREKVELNKKFQKITETIGPGGETENVTGWDHVTEWEPDLILNSGTTMPETFDVLTDSASGKWLVMEGSEVFEYQGHDMLKAKLKKWSAGPMSAIS